MAAPGSVKEAITRKTRASVLHLRGEEPQSLHVMHITALQDLLCQVSSLHPNW